MNTAVARENWEGQLVDGRFPLLHWLGSSEHSVVFLTKLPGQESQKAVIKLFPADARDAKTQISRWQVIAGLSHPHLIRLFHTGECEINAAALLYVVLEYAEEDLSQVVPSRALTPAEAGEMLKRYLASLALQAARGWKFNPRQIDGQNVASEWILRFQFRRTETLVVPSLRLQRTSSLARRHRQNRRQLPA